MTRTHDSKGSARRLYVLDTNVLLHDPFSMFKFEEHDIFIPFVTLEELDSKKAGNQDINRNARQATRNLEEVVSQDGFSMDVGYPLNSFNGGHARGKLFVQRKSLPFLSDEHIRKNDNLYLSALKYLEETEQDTAVIMVTKDLNLRIKARAMGFKAEDYRHDHAVEDADLLYKGIRYVGDDWFEQFGDGIESWKRDQHTYYRVPKFECLPNEFLCFDSGDLYQVVEVDADGVVLESVIDTTKDKHAIAGICARNEEQRAALALLTDPDVDFVALLGIAGTGKTLLALAAALAQADDEEGFDDILFTRATIALGDEIGFLPGTEEEKLAPWLGALQDSADVIIEAAGKSEISQQDMRTLVKEKVHVRAITFMRGRTFHKKFVILDEAQNLTPKQMKALITRAGEGTKVVCLGNLAQIDSPYLSETSSGLAYAVERFKGWPHFGSLVLHKGERSRLANEGNTRL